MRRVLALSSFCLLAISQAAPVQDAKEVALAKKVVKAVLEFRLGDNSKPSFSSAKSSLFSVSEQKVKGEGTVIVNGKKRTFTFDVKVRRSNGNVRDVNIDVD